MIFSAHCQKNDSFFIYAETSPDFAETSPDFAETSPDFAETSPDFAETSPDFAETSPDFLEGVSKMCHGGLDPPSPEKSITGFQGIADLRFASPAMTRIKKELLTHPLLIGCPLYPELRLRLARGYSYSSPSDLFTRLLVYKSRKIWQFFSFRLILRNELKEMKQIADWKVKENIPFNSNYCLLKLTLEDALPEILPGQFVQVKVDDSESTFLRRPISVHYVDKANHELWLLIQVVGNGTRRLSEVKPGEWLNLIYPLGKGFSVSASAVNRKTLLIGGGVGVAPLLYLGACLKEKGRIPVFILGAKTGKDLLQRDKFGEIGTVHITTEDGSAGEKGFVTGHSVLSATDDVDFIYTCGPKPMMLAVARYARRHSIPCEVSLENTMACGIGACLCCVEKTKQGNVCVCTEGPVFNINQLITWQI